MQAGRLCSRRRNRCRRLDRFCGERRQCEKEPTDQAVISVLSLGICCEEVEGKIIRKQGKRQR